jgi:nucleotide-binding universal stress UspA family protein
MKEHILVPLAGVSELDTVLPHLRTLVRRGATDLTLLRTELPASVEGFDLLRDAALAHARAFLARAKRRLSRLKVRVQTAAAIGAPAETILQAARDRKATLILLSSSRRPSLTRFLFGSVAEQVVRRSPVPVVVIPSGPSCGRETVGAGSRRSDF